MRRRANSASIGAVGWGSLRPFAAPKVLPQDVLGDVDVPEPVALAAPQPEVVVSNSMPSSSWAEVLPAVFHQQHAPSPEKKRPRDDYVITVPSCFDATLAGAEVPSDGPTEEEQLQCAQVEEEEDQRRCADVAFTQRSRSAEDAAFAAAAGVPLTPSKVSSGSCTTSRDTFYGLPCAVERLYQTRGVCKLYEWQHTVLTSPHVVAGRNFVYSLPTSGGKTLVAEILLMRCVMQRSKSAMLVVPFVSIAEEKTQALQLFANSFGFPCEGYYGTNGRFPLSHAASIYVCTMEKANSLYNHMCEEGRHEDIGLVVVDELHMVGEPRRGAVLELFLSKVLFQTRNADCATTDLFPWDAACNTTDSLPQKNIHRTQIVGMSATVPNLPVIARWLRAECYVSDFRPVPLKQYSVCDGVVLEDGQVHTRSLPCHTDHESVLYLVSELPDCSTLVFCPTRQSTMDTAKQIARGLVRLLQWPPRPQAAQLVDELKSIAQDDTVSVLAETMPFGVAYHHGGLLMEEREYIERCYRQKRIQILCCTSTLAAGVNLPARRVVFRTPFVARDFLTKSRYLQMCGRAGRAGLDAYGESFLLLSKRDRDAGHALMRGAMDDTRSAMLLERAQTGEERPIQRALLECVGVGILRTINDVMAFSRVLLCYCEAQATGEAPLVFAANFERLVQESLVELETLQLVAVTRRAPSNADGSCDEAANENASREDHDLLIHATPFGASAVRSCFAIEEAVMVRDELAILQETGLVLSDDLHICYFLTPLREVTDCNWEAYLRILGRMNDTRQRIAEALGVNECFVYQCAMGMAQHSSPAAPNIGTTPVVPNLLSDPTKRELFTTKRFYVAMMLSDLLNEVPFADVEAKYKVNRGQLQSLMKSASMFSSSITSFCSAMNWFSLEAVLSSYVKRLGFGVRPDIVPLMEIKGVQASRARALWNAGYKSAASLAAATPTELVERVKAKNAPDCKAAKFFSIRSAVAVVREATKLVHMQVKEKREELVELTARTKGLVS